MKKFVVKTVAVSLCFLLAYSVLFGQNSFAPEAKRTFKVTNVKKAKKFRYDPKKLAKPFATKSVVRPSKFVDIPEGANLKVPKGFEVEIFADREMFERLSYPRLMAEAPNGDIFVTDSRRNRRQPGGKILILRDTDKDGKPDKTFVFTDKVIQPFGIRFHKNYLYVGNTNSVVRFKYTNGQTKVEGSGEKLLDLPGFGYNQHWTRNLVISPDGKKLYVTVGSESNVSVEPEPRRAAISVYDIDGKNHKLFATGLRNPTGITFNPKTGELWTSVNERDRIGDELVPDYVTSVKPGGFYGFPFSYIGNNIDPRRAEDVEKMKKQELVSKTLIPDVLLTSHSAAIGLRFYEGNNFPKKYRNDLFVALHGSWNRAKLTGYKVIRIKFDKKGKLKNNGYEDFVSGWLPDEDSNEVWGRPAGILFIKDGSMLITDDRGQRIYRVYYKG